MHPTTRLYLNDDHCFETDAIVVAVQGDAVAFDRTCFYPGGGGQPPDTGAIRLHGGASFAIESAQAGADDVIWHAATSSLPGDIVGQTARLREALACHNAGRQCAYRARCMEMEYAPRIDGTAAADHRETFEPRAAPGHRGPASLAVALAQRARENHAGEFTHGVTTCDGMQAVSRWSFR